MGHNVAHLFASVCFSKMPKNMPQAILGYLNPQNWIMSMTYDLRARRVARNNSSIKLMHSDHKKNMDSYFSKAKLLKGW